MTSSILWGNSNEDQADQLNLPMACKHGKKAHCGHLWGTTAKINHPFTGKFGRRIAPSVSGAKLRRAGDSRAGEEEEEEGSAEYRQLVSRFVAGS